MQPYGAEEIRLELTRRKQQERLRDKEERLRRQAYKEELEVGSSGWGVVLVATLDVVLVATLDAMIVIKYEGITH